MPISSRTARLGSAGAPDLCRAPQSGGEQSAPPHDWEARAPPLGKRGQHPLAGGRILVGGHPRNRSPVAACAPALPGWLRSGPAAASAGPAGPPHSNLSRKLKLLWSIQYKVNDMHKRPGKPGPRCGANRVFLRGICSSRASGAGGEGGCQGWFEGKRFCG